jgi:hypothetical protein
MLSPYIHAALAPCLATTRPEPPARSPAAVPDAGQELSSAELRYFTDVDHHDHEALGTLNHPGGAVSVSPVTSATPTTPQGRALGTELVAQLCQQSGITVCA